MPSTTTSRDGDTVSSASELIEPSPPTSYKAGRRHRPHRPHRRLALVVSATSLLISLSTMALVMWYASDVGPTIALLQRKTLPAASTVSASRPGDGERDAHLAAQQQLQQRPPPVVSSTTAPTTSAAVETTMPMPVAETTTALQPGYECTSNRPGVLCSSVAYPRSCNVTNWEKDDKFCTRDNTNTFTIDRTGWYYIYSQAWLAGTMHAGVILRLVPNEASSRSLLVKHSIMCWQNCDGRGPRRLREAEITALDVLTTHVSLQVRLQKGAVLGVNVTSPNVNEGAWTWNRVVFGLWRLS